MSHLIVLKSTAEAIERCQHEKDGPRVTPCFLGVLDVKRRYGQQERPDNAGDVIEKGLTHFVHEGNTKYPHHGVGEADQEILIADEHECVSHCKSNGQWRDAQDRGEILLRIEHFKDLIAPQAVSRPGRAVAGRWRGARSAS